MLSRLTFACRAVMLLLPCTAADAEVIDLSSFAHGEKISGADLAASGVSDISSDGLPSHLGVGIYDTAFGTNGADEDLEVNIGNALYFQNSNNSADGGGSDIWTNPNDDPNGGTMVFTFTNPLELLSVDVIDIDTGNLMVLTLTDSSNRTRTYTLPSDWTGDIVDDGGDGYGTLDLTFTGAQTGVGPGTPDSIFAQDVDFDATMVSSFSVMLSGSGGIANVQYVPEPGSLTLFSVFCLGHCRRRRS